MTYVRLKIHLKNIDSHQIAYGENYGLKISAYPDL